jgi:ABC-type transport system involved in cytochrome bd biosynthesis fused ATPase/permease subunit
MSIAIGVTATLAILSLAVIFGTDMSVAVVQRAVYRELDDRTMVRIVGRGHYYGDRRFPVIGIGGTIVTAATVVLAFVGVSPLAAVLAAAAFVLLLVWLLLFARIAKPINTVLTAAAATGEVPANARALQERWESIIIPRAVLLGIAIALLCATLFLV